MHLAVLQIHQCSFCFPLSKFRVQTVSTVMNATVGVQISPRRTHPCAHFSHCVRCDTSHTSSNAPALSDSFCVFPKSSHPRTMSLLGVPDFLASPPVLTSSTTTPTPLTGIRLNPCATPLWGGPSGHLADATPNTSVRGSPTQGLLSHQTQTKKNNTNNSTTQPPKKLKNKTHHPTPLPFWLMKPLSFVHQLSTLLSLMNCRPLPFLPRL